VTRPGNFDDTLKMSGKNLPVVSDSIGRADRDRRTLTVHTSYGALHHTSYGRAGHYHVGTVPLPDRPVGFTLRFGHRRDCTSGAVAVVEPGENLCQFATDLSLV